MAAPIGSRPATLPEQPQPERHEITIGVSNDAVDAGLQIGGFTLGFAALGGAIGAFALYRAWGNTLIAPLFVSAGAVVGACAGALLGAIVGGMSAATGD